MRANFRVGDVFPADAVVSPFLVGLCMAVNDLMWLTRRPETDGDGESNYRLYLICAYYREAAKFLGEGLKQAEVSAFLKDLSPEGREYLEVVRESFDPWEGSFAERALKPVRDIVFHYPRRSEMRALLRRLSDSNSHIEMGACTYMENRYGIADDVLATYVSDTWGGSVSELSAAMKRVVGLALALTYFAHEAVALRLRQVDSRALNVTGQDVRR